MAEEKNTTLALLDKAGAEKIAKESFKKFPNRTPLYITEDGVVHLSPRYANRWAENREMEVFTIKK